MSLQTLGLTFLSVDEAKLANRAFRAAHTVNRDDPRYRIAARRRKLVLATLAPPILLAKSPGQRRGLLTGEDARLAKLAREVGGLAGIGIFYQTPQAAAAVIGKYSVGVHGRVRSGTHAKRNSTRFPSLVQNDRVGQ